MDTDNVVPDPRQRRACVVPHAVCHLSHGIAPSPEFPFAGRPAAEGADPSANSVGGRFARLRRGGDTRCHNDKKTAGGALLNPDDRPLRILVVEDNQNAAAIVGEYLELNGHIPDFAMDGIGGLHLALTQSYDAIVLDIALPKMDGMTFCRKLREEGGYETPVLMVTGRDRLIDKLEGFEAGADDYLVKPFALEELKARLLALVRRKDKGAPARLQVEDLVLDLGTMRVERDGREIQLCRIHLKILTILMKAFPNVVSRGDLEIALWGDQPPGSDVMRSHIYALRKAIDRPFDHPILETVHGIGYRLAGFVSASQ